MSLYLFSRTGCVWKVIGRSPLVCVCLAYGLLIVVALIAVGSCVVGGFVGLELALGLVFKLVATSVAFQAFFVLLSFWKLDHKILY